MINAGDTYLESLGRILQLERHRKKRLSLQTGGAGSDPLTEIDSSGAEYQRGDENNYDSRAQRSELPGCPGQMHQICAA